MSKNDEKHTSELSMEDLDAVAGGAANGIKVLDKTSPPSPTAAPTSTGTGTATATGTVTNP